MLTSGLVTVKVTTVPSPDMANRLTLSYKGYDFKQNKVIFFKSQISALHFGHLEHPLLGHPLLMTKDEVRLRISVHRLVGFGAPVDSLQVSQTRAGSCNEAIRRLGNSALFLSPFVWFDREQHIRDRRDDDT